MKRIFAIGLALILTLALLAGCGEVTEPRCQVPEDGQIKVNGKKYVIGGKIIVNDKLDEYDGLKGTIVEIRTDDDKETDNTTSDIVCRFISPEDKESICKLEKIFSELYREPKTIEDIILDEVIMDISSLEPLQQ